MEGRCGTDAERFRAPQALRRYLAGYLPRNGCGVGPSGRGVSVPSQREFSSLDEAKASNIPGFALWIEGPDGYHTYGYGRWQFTPHRKAA